MPQSKDTDAAGRSLCTPSSACPCCRCRFCKSGCTPGKVSLLHKVTSRIKAARNTSTAHVWHVRKELVLTLRKPSRAPQRVSRRARRAQRAPPTTPHLRAGPFGPGARPFVVSFGASGGQIELFPKVPKRWCIKISLRTILTQLGRTAKVDCRCRLRGASWLVRTQFAPGVGGAKRCPKS